MLQSFSWQAFWLAAIMLSFLWYLGLALTVYRAEVFGFLGISSGHSANDSFRGLGQKPGFLPKPQNEIPDNVSAGELINADEGLMGRSRLPDGVEQVSMSQVMFKVDEKSREDQVGLVADVIQELKGVFLELPKSDGGKKEFMAMVRELNYDYGGIGGHPSIGAINGFIREHAPFHLNDEELENMWY